MITVDVKTQLNLSHIEKRLDTFKDRLYPMIKQRIKAGADPYTPYVDGGLMDSAKSSAVDSTEYLVYNIKYAKYQYYANGGAPDRDFEGRTRDKHPQATMMWVGAYLDSGGKAEIQRLCKGAPKLLNF